MPKYFFALLTGILAAIAVVTAGSVAYLLMRGPAAPLSAKAPMRSSPELTYVPEEIGFPATGHPMITHVAIADLEGTGMPGILVCDATANRIGWIRQQPRGVFTEQFIGDPVQGPAHIAVCDMNGDGAPTCLWLAWARSCRTTTASGRSS